MTSPMNRSVTNKIKHFPQLFILGMQLPLWHYVLSWSTISTKVYLYIYIYIFIYIYIYIYLRSAFINWALWRTLMRTGYFLFVHHTTSILAKLSTLVTSVVLYSLTWATLMSPGKDETRVYISMNMIIFASVFYNLAVLSQIPTSNTKLQHLFQGTTPAQKWQLIFVGLITLN